MSTKAADQYGSIAQRLNEIEAEKVARVSAPEPKAGEYAAGWPVIKDVNAPLDSPLIYGGGITWVDEDYDPA